MIRFLLLYALTVSLSIVGAAEPVFKVLPPDQIAFNYPDPPSEGKADFFSIAENGEARCVVVLPKDPEKSFRAAASEFTAYLKLATGAGIQIIEDGGAIPEGLGAIHVGETSVAKSIPLDLPELEYGDERFPNRRGFLVKTLNPQTLVIRGYDDEATEHGLVGFLKRYAGIRQYWHGAPDGMGNVIPDQPSLSIPEVEWRDWPYFASFQMSLRSFGKRPYLDFYRRNAALPCGENYNQWLPPSRWVESHPEYYALVNGKRLKPKDSDGNKGWQPCVSNPDVPRVMAGAVIEHFRGNPEIAGINVAINDGGGDCMCGDCRALDAPDADYSRNEGISDRYVYLTNKICEIVGEEFPDKWIVYLAYAAAQSAPSTIVPHPRMLPVTTTGSTFERVDEWVKSGASHFGIYAHHLDTFAIMPKMDVYQQAKRIRYAVGSGKARTYYMECHTQWPFADVIPYVTAELLWDPRTDVDQLLDEYFSSFYGEAEAPMRDYYSVLTEGYNRWLGEKGRPHSFGRDMSSYAYNKSLDQFRVLSPDEASRAVQALERATDSAKADTLAANRIEIIRAAFQLQKIAVDRGWAAFRLRDEAPRTEAEARERIADARLIYERSGEAEKYIENVLEQPPFDQWQLFRNMSKPLARYAELKSGEPDSEIRSIVSLGLHNTAEFIRSEMGSEAAAAWWQAEAENEGVPELKTAFTSAGERSLEPPATNLLADPGFEEFTDVPPNASGEIVLDESKVREAGVHHTFPDRTPYRIAISTEEVHSGKHSLMLEHCSQARFSKHVSVEPNTAYRAGLWFRQDEGTTSPYTFSVDARMKDGSYQMLSTFTIPAEPNEWKQFVSDVKTPPGVSTIFVRLHAQNQAAGTRCWIDDVMLSK